MTFVDINKVTAISNDPVTFSGHLVGQTVHKGHIDLGDHGFEVIK